MHVISVFPAASTELAITALAAAAPALASVIVRIVLCALAASATRKALEDLAGGQATWMPSWRTAWPYCAPSWPR